MQKVMQDNAAVYRTQETLAAGRDLIDVTVKNFRDVKVGRHVACSMWVGGGGIADGDITIFMMYSLVE